MEQTKHICAKCGREFSCIDEANDIYSNYCDHCYKVMIQERGNIPDGMGYDY